MTNPQFRVSWIGVSFVRLLTLLYSVLTAIMVSACDFWPDELGPLAESIEREVAGETTAWRVGGDVVVINVANSPLYRENSAELQAAATDIAAQAITFADVPLESVSVTFHEGDVSEEAEKLREFIFLVKDNRPVLQPLLDDAATGPLTLAEIQALFMDMDEPLSEKLEVCVSNEIEERARAAGDPETLDPATVEFLPVDEWHRLDIFGKRLVLAQVISTKAMFVCGRSGERRTH